MTTAYCFKCKKQMELINGITSEKAGKRFLKGNCKECNTIMNKILPKIDIQENLGAGSTYMSLPAQDNLESVAGSGAIVESPEKINPEKVPISSAVDSSMKGRPQQTEKEKVEDYNKVFKPYGYKLNTISQDSFYKIYLAISIIIMIILLVLVAQDKFKSDNNINIDSPTINATNQNYNSYNFSLLNYNNNSLNLNISIYPEVIVVFRNIS